MGMHTLYSVHKSKEQRSREINPSENRWLFLFQPAQTGKSILDRRPNKAKIRQHLAFHYDIKDDSLYDTWSRSRCDEGGRVRHQHVAGISPTCRSQVEGARVRSEEGAPASSLYLKVPA